MEYSSDFHALSFLSPASSLSLSSPSYTLLSSLPTAFLSFLSSNSIPQIFFSDSVIESLSSVRYIRFKPNLSFPHIKESLIQLEEEGRKEAEVGSRVEIGRGAGASEEKELGKEEVGGKRKKEEGEGKGEGGGGGVEGGGVGGREKGGWKKIEGVPNMFEIRGDKKICGLASYKRGEAYGIDLSSAAVVMALDPKPSDYVLDLCCSPGAKLCFIADLLKLYPQPPPSSTSPKPPPSPSIVFPPPPTPLSSIPLPSVTHPLSSPPPTFIQSPPPSFLPSAGLVGVDINENRLNICRNLLKKYGHSDVELFLDDGVFFNKRSKFDKVLVDAECTHDGSIKHFKKFWKEEEGEIGIIGGRGDGARGGGRGKGERRGEGEGGENGGGEEKRSKFVDGDKITKKICRKKDNKKEGEEKKKENEGGRRMEEEEEKENKKDDEEAKKEEKESRQGKIEVKISNKERKRRLKQKMLQNQNPYLSEKKGKNEWKMRDFEERFLDQKKLNEITSLQLKLLKNGFKLTKKGGILVYSTCTFSRKQNEEVILKFMEEEGGMEEKLGEEGPIGEHAGKGKMEILEVFDKETMKQWGCYEGFLEKTIRFDPIKSKCGGMFICKIKKLVD